jgi:hypothetical protein
VSSLLYLFALQSLQMMKHMAIEITVAMAASITKSSGHQVDFRWRQRDKESMVPSSGGTHG